MCSRRIFLLWLDTPADTTPATRSSSTARSSFSNWCHAECCARAARSVIGNGVVLDPMAFLKEVAALRETGVKVDGSLFVSNRAHVILPYHRLIELASEKPRRDG